MHVKDGKKIKTMKNWSLPTEVSLKFVFDLIIFSK